MKMRIAVMMKNTKCRRLGSGVNIFNILSLHDSCLVSFQLHANLNILILIIVYCSHIPLKGPFHLSDV